MEVTQDSCPLTPDGMNRWLFKKLTEIELKNETLHGDVRVAIANHEALEKRVTDVEVDAKDARKWENIKFAGTGFVQAAVIWFKHTAGLHGV